MTSIKPDTQVSLEWLAFIRSLTIPCYSDSSTMLLARLAEVLLQK